MAVTQHVFAQLPVTLNCNIADAQKILQALGNLPHNAVHGLIVDLTEQIQHQVNQHVAASQTMNGSSQANGHATPATSPAVE